MPDQQGVAILYFKSEITFENALTVFKNFRNIPQKYQTHISIILLSHQLISYMSKIL